MNLKMQRPEPLADYMSKTGVPMPDYSREDERIYFSFSIKGFRTKIQELPAKGQLWEGWLCHNWPFVRVLSHLKVVNGFGGLFSSTASIILGNREQYVVK